MTYNVLTYYFFVVIVYTFSVLNYFLKLLNLLMNSIQSLFEIHFFSGKNHKNIIIYK